MRGTVRSQGWGTVIRIQRWEEMVPVQQGEIQPPHSVVRAQQKIILIMVGAQRRELFHCGVWGTGCLHLPTNELCTWDYAKHCKYVVSLNIIYHSPRSF